MMDSNKFIIHNSQFTILNNLLFFLALIEVKILF